jgi:hypothetical protein
MCRDATPHPRADAPPHHALGPTLTLSPPLTLSPHLLVALYPILVRAHPLGPPRQTLPHSRSAHATLRRLSRALTTHSPLPRPPPLAHSLPPIHSFPLTRSLLAPSLLFHSATRFARGSLAAAAPTPPRFPSPRSAPSRTATSRPARPSSTSSPGRPSPRPTSRRPSNHPSRQHPGSYVSHTPDVSTYDLSLRVEAARLQVRLDLLAGAARLAVRDHAPDGEADLPSAPSLHNS